jgi:hypothetical protein
MSRPMMLSGNDSENQYEIEFKIYLPEIVVLASLAAIVGGKLIWLSIHLGDLIRTRFTFLVAICGVASNARRQVVTHLFCVLLILRCNATIICESALEQQTYWKA